MPLEKKRMKGALENVTTTLCSSLKVLDGVHTAIAVVCLIPFSQTSYKTSTGKEMYDPQRGNYPNHKRTPEKDKTTRLFLQTERSSTTSSMHSKLVQLNKANTLAPSCGCCATFRPFATKQSLKHVGAPYHAFVLSFW